MPRRPGDPNHPRRGNGAGKGAGWGGPAKGAGKPPGSPEAGRPPRDVAALKAASREARIEALKQKLADLAFNAQREETQLSAAVALLNREEGLPVARQISATVDSADKVLRIEIVDEPGANPAADGSPATPAARFQH